MRTVLFASLRVYARRYAAALSSVALAVAFVIATSALVSAAKSGLNSGIDTAFTGADLVAGDSYGIGTDAYDQAAQIATRDGVDLATLGYSYESLTDAEGRQLDAQTSIGTVSLDPHFQWQKLTGGHMPQSADEALVDENAALSRGIHLGDRLTIGSSGAAIDVEVVGFVERSSVLSSPVYVPWEKLSELPGALPEALLIAGDDAALQTLRDELEQVDDLSVSTREQYVDDKRVELNRGVDAVSYVVLVFGAVAAFAAILVVGNTFTILFAQRSRDLALLRAVGARRSEVTRSVRGEALVIGVIASAIGLVVGALAGLGITAVVRAFAGAERIGAVQWSIPWWVGAFVGGVVVTVIAVWLPTRAVTRVSPLAALRPDAPTDARSAAGRRRVVWGLITTVVGLIPLIAGMLSVQVLLSMLGCALVFVGVLIAGPVVVPTVISLLGRGVRRVGAPSRFAVDNAVRNPRRTAATAASLLVGITLTVTILTVTASGRSALTTSLDEQYPVDLVVSSQTTAASSELVERVKRTPDVRDAVGVAGTTVQTDAFGEWSVIAPDEAALDLVRGSRTAFEVPADEVLIPADLSSGGDVYEVPETLQVAGSAGSVELRTHLVPAEWGGTLVVAPQTLARLTAEPEVQAIWARASADADGADLGGDVGLIARSGDLELTNQVQERSRSTDQLDTLVGVVIGLLAVSVVIAVVGIGNSLGLSVLERGRENALVRALGLTRRQLRRSLAVEGVLLAIAAGLIGTALGIFFGWAGVRTVVDVGVEGSSLVVPVGQLALVIVVAAVAGLIACVLPARRAARISPAEGLVSD